MTGPHRMAAAHDPVAPGPAGGIELTVDGSPVRGLAGQTIAGVLLGAGRLTWRSSRTGRPRGVFCGIGVCHDCLVTVNGLADVRACQRRAANGDAITTTEPPVSLKQAPGAGLEGLVSLEQAPDPAPEALVSLEQAPDPVSLEQAPDLGSDPLVSLEQAPDLAPDPPVSLKQAPDLASDPPVSLKQAPDLAPDPPVSSKHPPNLPPDPPLSRKQPPPTTPTPDE